MRSKPGGGAVGGAVVNTLTSLIANRALVPLCLREHQQLQLSLNGTARVHAWVHAWVCPLCVVYPPLTGSVQQGHVFTVGWFKPVLHHIRQTFSAFVQYSCSELLGDVSLMEGEGQEETTGQHTHTHHCKYQWKVNR